MSAVVAAPPEPPAPSTSPSLEEASKAEAAAKTPEKIEVKPVARDDEIADRLIRILTATHWFQSVHVRVDEGIVFLQGQTGDDQLKKWAGDLARNTRDVVAVVNQIQVKEPFWDSSALKSQLSDMSRNVLVALPTLVFACIVLPLAWFGARLTTRVTRRVLNPTIHTDLLRRAISNSCGVLVFLIAAYLVLRVAGMTQLALTLVGGTGLLGLALGIAFKDITENFLSSIYLSIQKPFNAGDLVEIDSLLGYVQRVTARTTILMTLDGHHVQIPNATVFKNTIRNYTSNPHRRIDFNMPIAFDASIPDAQETALQVLRSHPAVLNDPEPWVLVDGVANATVSLKVYFWIDSSQHSWLKVRSAIIRLTKAALQNGRFLVPIGPNEISIPNGVSVQLVERHAMAPHRVAPTPPVPVAPDSKPQPVSSTSEGNLSSDADKIQQLADNSRVPEQGENLLKDHADAAR